MKTTKTIQKLKALPHPKDRKVDQLQRQLRHDAKLAGTREDLECARSGMVARCFWFRQQCLAVPQRSKWSNDDATALAELFIERNDDEVAALKLVRNCPQGRIRHLTAQKQLEADEFRSAKGLLIPDIITDDGLEILTQVWDGDHITFGVVPQTRLSFLKRGAGVVAAREKLTGLLRQSSEVRAAQPKKGKKACRFNMEGQRALQRGVSHAERTKQRRTSVKATLSSTEIAATGKQRRVLQTQNRSKLRRQAAIAHSRGLI